MTTPGPMTPTDAPPPPARRRRPMLIAGAVAVVVLLGGAGAAYALRPGEDSGVAACRRIAEISTAGGARPTITEQEVREITRQLRGSGHAKLVEFGDIYQIGVDRADAGDRKARITMEGFPAASTLIVAAGIYCADAGVDVPVTRPN